MEINEQQLKKIQELTKQVCDLEEENSALAQEHLVMVKKQQQPNSDEKEQSTMADSKGNLATEESAEVIANKDKQIELLSNMLEQKELTMAKDALKWAARTYVVAALGALASLLYWAIQILGSRD